MDGIEIMLTGKAAAYAGGAAVAGGAARFLARGNYKVQVFVQDIVGAVFGWCLVVASSVVYPALTDDPWVFASIAFLSAYIAPALLAIVFTRIEKAEISFEGAGIEFHSKGSDEKEMKP